MQLHDVDVVPCYHVNGRLNVLGRDKRVCSLTIYVAATSSVPSIRPAKAGRILSLDPSPGTRGYLSNSKTARRLIHPPLRGAELLFLPACMMQIRDVNVSFVSGVTDVAVNRRCGAFVHGGMSQRS